MAHRLSQKFCPIEYESHTKEELEALQFEARRDHEVQELKAFSQNLHLRPPGMFRMDSGKYKHIFRPLEELESLLVLPAVLIPS